MNDELNSPPFDPTPVENPLSEFATKLQQYTIVARGADLTAVPLGYPETGQPVPESEKITDLNLRNCWRNLFGPSKAELREEVHIKGIEILNLLEQKAELLGERNSLYKKTQSLEKQVAIWEKTYTTVSELAQQRIRDIATLRQSLNTANEEIERLCMAPQLIAKSKAPRKKKGNSGR